MGYTHYWRMSRDFNDQEWGQITEAAQKLIEAAPTSLCEGYGKTGNKPTVDGEEICFNAANEDEQCEDFWLTKGRQDFEFCKTREYPYDQVVVSILAIAAKIAPKAITVSSDGWDSDWKKGLDFGSKILGQELPYPCKSEE